MKKCSDKGASVISSRTFFKVVPLAVQIFLVFGDGSIEVIGNVIFVNIRPIWFNFADCWCTTQRWKKWVQNCVYVSSERNRSNWTKCSISSQIVNYGWSKDLKELWRILGYQDVSSLFPSDFSEGAIEISFEFFSRDVYLCVANFLWHDLLCIRRGTWLILLGKPHRTDFFICGLLIGTPAE